MINKVLIVSATEFEIIPIIDYLEKNAVKASMFSYQFKGIEINTLVTGVGSMMTAFGMSRLKNINENDLLINAGIAGSYDRTYKLGDVFEVTKDKFADLGVEESNGDFTDIYQLELYPKDKFPFENGWITNEGLSKLKKVSSITVNKVNGTKNAIEKISAKYNPDLESMEGAGFCYASKMLDIKFVQIRSVSNYVEPRNRDNWKLNLAIDNLNVSLLNFLISLAQ